MGRGKKYRFSSLSPSLLPVLPRCPASLHDAVQLIESLSKNDGDSNKNGKKAIDLISKTTSLHVHHAFLYISSPVVARLRRENAKICFLWRKWLQSWVDFVTLIVQSYFDTLLRYVLSVTFRGAVVMKVMAQKTLVKSRWSYKVRITVCILTPKRVCQTRGHKSLIDHSRK